MSGEKEKENKALDVDNIYRRINAKGRWQIGVYLLHCGMYTTMAYHYMAFIFIIDTPAHHCKIPPNATKNETIPKILEDGRWVDDRCHMYVNLSQSNATMKCPNGWEFDPNSGYISTIVTDFELVCGKNIMVEIQLMVSNTVLAVCQVFATRVADVFGRKPVFLTALTIRFIAGVGKAFSPNMITYIIMDALLHIAMTGFTATLLVMSMELFPTEYRTMAGTCLEFAWVLSLMLVSLMVYLFRNWRVLEVVMYAPLIFGVAYFWLIDESVPWLMVKKRYAKAEKIIRKGAAFNKVAIPQDLFQGHSKAQALEESHTASKTSLRRRSGNLISSNISLSSAAEAIGKSAYGSGPIWVKREDTPTAIDKKRAEAQREEDDEQTGILDVFKSKKMLFISVINFLLWFCNSMVYSALNLTVTYLSGDRYMNFFLLNVAEIPAIIGFHFALNRFGRRWPICIFHIICGVALLLTLLEVTGVVTNAPWFGIGLNFVGKFAITASYCAILVYAPELYPTNVRSMFFGLCWFFAYVAQIIAPYCRPMEMILPGFVRGACGALSIVVGLLVLLLPETFKRPFPKTISEIEGWTRTVSKEELQRYKDMKENNLAEAQALNA